MCDCAEPPAIDRVGEKCLELSKHRTEALIAENLQINHGILTTATLAIFPYGQTI